jgi:hypothetical protein
VAEGAGEIIAHQIFTLPPPPSSLAPVTHLLEQIILRALAKEPALRFGSADEMNAALQAVVPGEPSRLAANAPTAIAAPGPRSYPPPYQLPSQPPAQTTMSAAAGAAVVSTAARPRRAWLATLGAVVAVAAAAAVFVTTRGGSPQAPLAAPTHIAASPPPSTPIAPPPAIAAPAPAVPAPAKATLIVSSNPPDAEVYRMPQGVRIGTTPLHYTIDATEGDVVLLVKKRGYRDETIALPADHDAERAVALVRKAASAPSSNAAPVDDFLTKTSGPSNDSVDPFAKPSKRP